MKTTADKQQQQHGLPHDGATPDSKKTPLMRLQQGWTNWVEDQNRKNEERASKPDNIVVSKIAVVLCAGLLVWCYYVYVGRICTPMIRQDAGAKGSRAQGIVFLIFFNILWLLMSYTYAMVCTTPPGYAKDVVERGPRPEPPWLGYPPNTNIVHPHELPHGAEGYPAPQHDNHLVAGPQYAPNPQAHSPSMPNDGPDVPLSGANSAAPAGSVSDTSDHTLVQASQPNAREITGHAANGNPYTPLQPIQNAGNKAHPLEDPQVAADKFGQTGALGAGAANVAAALTTHGEHAASTQQREATQAAYHPYNSVHQAQPSAAISNGEEAGFKRKVYREVPVRLPLHPNTRYCERCELVKPHRAHHCRHCGTCILGMDHHCPWIGQCCGARNHIYFVAFCFWSCIALTYVFVTLLISLIAPNVNPSPEIDVQTVVICAIAAVLGFFTGSMFTTHVVLILQGQSTIENISIGDMKHRETSALNRHYSMFAFKSKNRERKLMDKEWGKLDTEAHLWYQGNKKKNWEMTMGTVMWKWFVPPPGYRPDDGVDYSPNPRRGTNGEWRRREDWPKELQ